MLTPVTRKQILNTNSNTVLVLLTQIEHTILSIVNAQCCIKKAHRCFPPNRDAKLNYSQIGTLCTSSRPGLFFLMHKVALFLPSNFFKAHYIQHKRPRQERKQAQIQTLIELHQTGRGFTISHPPLSPPYSPHQRTLASAFSGIPHCTNQCNSS
jgi:hypothetical protein